MPVARRLDVKWISTAIVAAAVVAGLGRGAEAGTLRLAYNPSDTDGYSANSGGEFRVTEFREGGVDLSVSPLGPDVALPGGVFQTFCLERDEYFDPGSQYKWSVNTQALLGGFNTNAGDPLDPRTAYVYTQFWNGTLSATYLGTTYTYDYSDLGLDGGANAPSGNVNPLGRKNSAAALQNLIWAIEQEYGNASDEAGILAQLTSNAARAWYYAARDAGWTDIGNVRVLNLTEKNVNGTWVTGHFQDQLYMVPLPSAAWAGLGLLGGMGLVGVVRRRSRRELA